MDNYRSITPKGTEPIWREDPKNPAKNRFASHEEAERHYDSALLNVYQANQELGKYLTKYGPLIDEQPVTFTPEGIQQRFDNGMLYKPVADSGGAIVLVMAPRYCEPSNQGMRVTLLGRDGKVIEQSLRFTGCANGGRPNHRGKYKAVDLVSSAPLYFTWTHGGEKQWLIVPDPQKRME